MYYRLPYVHRSIYNFLVMAMAIKNYPRPFHRDVLHRPLCKDSDQSPRVEPLLKYSPSLTAMSMSPETQNMKLKRNMVYFTQEEMYVNPLGIRRLALTPALFNDKILLGKKRPFKELIAYKRYEERDFL